jgi:hypothetical protein
VLPPLVPVLGIVLGLGVAVQDLGAQTEPSCTDPVLVNPSFEEPQIPGPWTRVSSMPGWVGPVDIHRLPDLPVSDGVQIVDLNQSAPGSITQVFDTEAGRRYTITFDHGVNYHCTNEAVFSVEIDGTPVASYDSVAAIHRDSYSFTAISDRTALSFVSLTGGCGAATIDNVRVACDVEDLDLDGVDDGLEDDLIALFAPEIRLDHRERYLPSSVEWYLDRVQMRYDHPHCPDHQILDRGEVTAGSLIDQRHSTTNLICSHTSTEESSADPPASDFFLQIPNGRGEQATRRGSDPEEWTCYAHVYPVPGGGYDVQYWIFYPYNGKVRKLGGAHEGDWEHVTVRVDDSGTSIDRVYLSAHEGGRWYDPSCLLETQDGRPIVYSALDSHAAYRGPGSPPPEAEQILDRTSDGGEVLDCSRSWVNVGELEAPRSGAEWLRYNGRWGEIGEVFSGPRGPAFHDDTWFERSGNVTVCVSPP